MNETVLDFELVMDKGDAVEVKTKGLFQFAGGIWGFSGRWERMSGSTWVFKTLKRSGREMDPSMRRHSYPCISWDARSLNRATDIVRNIVLGVVVSNYSHIS
jgi:hypothetical protein